MLLDFVTMLGKEANESIVVKMEEIFNNQVDISFNKHDLINKITIAINSIHAMEFLQSISSALTQKTDEKKLIGILGKPSHILNFPRSMSREVIVFYNHLDFWLGWKFKQDLLQSISVLATDVIPEIVKLQQFPMRICR